MSRRPAESESDPLALSFLDLISCGLGAAIFLSLIYSIVRQDAPASLTAPHFIDVTLKVHDLHSVMNLWIRPPNSSPQVLPLREFDLGTGRLRPGHPLEATGNYTLFGFTPFGESTLKLDRELKQQFLKLLIHEPQPGAWQIEVLYRDHRRWEELTPGQAVPPVRVERTVVLPRRVLEERAFHVTLGERSQFEQVIEVEQTPQSSKKASRR